MTTQGIPVGVKAVVIYKIADDYQSIANAARRFLDQEDQMDAKVHNVFAGPPALDRRHDDGRGDDPRTATR